MTDAPTQSGARLSRRGVERLDLLLLTVPKPSISTEARPCCGPPTRLGLQKPSFPIELSCGNVAATTHLRRITRRDQLDSTV